MANEICAKSNTGSHDHYFNASSTVLEISVLALLLAFASGFAVAADQKSNSNPCNISEEDAAGLNGDLSTDIHTTSDYRNTIARMLKEEKFETLDCLADRVRSGKERFPGGMWKIHTLYSGLYSPVQYPMHATEEDWSNLFLRLQRWVTERPKSVTARVALATAYYGYAWDARGNGFANTVSESGWKLFRDRSAEAKRILDEASILPTKCPEWYLSMLMVAQNQGWDMADVRSLYDKASNFEPGYYYYARMLASYLLPRWSGEKGATEKFMQEAADRIGGDQGDILYFQVASYVIENNEEDPYLSWERIEKGFNASEKQYGVSMLNLNLIAYLASYSRHHGDAFVADKALTRIGEQWDEELWGRKKLFDLAKQSAAAGAPYAAKQRANKAAAKANLQTPEGARYQVAFEKTYRELVQQCMGTKGGDAAKWDGEVETLTSVGVKGTVEEININPLGPAFICLFQKLETYHLQKTTTFPPPPQAPYWVSLDLDWADFAPAESK